MKKLLVVCFVFVFASCAVDYEPGKSLVTEDDRLVVNALLNPLKPISVRFYATGKTDTGYTFQAAEGVLVRLMENDNLLYEGICPDTILQLAHRPQTGALYSIQASLPGYESISATTSVPDSIKCTARMDLSTEYWTSQEIFCLSEFLLPEGEINLWITTYVGHQDGRILQYDELFANHPLADKINRSEGSMVIDQTIGSGYHDAFLRIRNKNLPRLDSLRYIPLIANTGVDYPPYDTQTVKMVKLITASKEYDQYNRSLYQQKASVVYDDDISAILYQPVSVYSNIKNGLGIFAGMSETNYLFEIPVNETVYP